MALRPWERMAYRLFGGRARGAIERNPGLRLGLQRAHIYLRPEMYLSAAYLFTVGAFFLALLPLLLVVALATVGLLAVPPRLYILLAPAPLVAAGIVYLLALLLPDLRALARARKIDAKLPYALNYISTVASAGATPEAIFTGLSKQPIYGAVAHESAWISRDLRLLGIDIIQALTQAIDRSPSVRFQDLLQGTINVLTSGGDLKTYFQQKADQFVYENRADQKKFLDSLSVLAESFVTVVVAAPLFLIVILSVMTSFGGDASQTLVLGYTLVFVMIPLSQAGFAWTIQVMTPEA